MKSTMESAFAIIAVALMIMVAVVPMVGVVDGDGTSTIVDPTSDTNEITVNVAVDSGKTVKIAYGKYSFTAVATGNGATFVLREASIASVRISVLTNAEAEDTNYPAVTLTNLVAGKEYNAVLKAGYESREVTFQFDNDQALDNDLVGTITAKYVVYSDDDGTTKISEGSFVFSDDGEATYLVPVGATSTVYLKVTSFSCSATSKITVDMTAYNELDGSSDTINTKQFLLTIDPADTVYGVVTVSDVVVGYTVDSSAKTKTATALNATMLGGTSGYEAYFFADVPTEAGTIGFTTVTMKLKADGTSVAETFDVSLASSWTLTYTPNAEAFFGQVTMNTDYTQAGTLKATLTVSDVDKAFTATVDEDGYFFKMVGYSAAPSAMTGITFTSNKVTYSAEDIDSDDITAGSAVEVDLTYEDLYAEVKGNLDIEENEDYTMAYELLTVTGATTFGSLYTDDEGNFEFMAETGKNIIISVTGAQLYGDVSAVVGTSSTTLKVTIEAKEITLDVADALGKAINAESDGVVLQLLGVDVTKFTASSTTGNYYAYVPANLNMSLYTVSIDATNYSFKEDPAFVEGKTYKAYEAQYTVSFYKADGETTLELTSGTDYNVYAAKAYKNTAGSVVYDYTGTDLTNTFIAEATTMAVEESDIGTTPIDVIILVKTSSADNKAILKDVYLLSSSKAAISIVASEDSLTAKLVRNDGVTAIAGATVTFGTDVTYTQADGSFTIYKDTEFATSDKVYFIKSGYTFDGTNGYAVVKDGENVTTFSPDADAYTISFVDADGKTIDVNGLTATVTGATITVASSSTNSVKATAAYTEAQDLTVTLLNGANAVRSFEDHALTAAEIASGKITIVSNQSTYIFNIADANGEPLEATVQLYKYYGDYAAEITTTNGTATADADGVATFLLPLVSETDLDTAYGYTVSLDDYTFSSAATKITAAETDVVSITGTKVVYLKNAAGLALSGTPSSVTIYADGVATSLESTKSAGMFSFLADDGVVYTYTITMSSGSRYSFEEEIADVSGIVNAKEETITGTVTDAAGNYFGLAVANIYAYDADGVKLNVVAGTQAATDKSFSIVADKSEIAYYLADAVTVSGEVQFTFEGSTTADIKAVETFVPITFVSANGLEDTNSSLAYTVTAVDALGNQTSKTVVEINSVEGVIADVDDVDYYVVSVTVAGDYFDVAKYTTDDGGLVSTVAGYTGKIGATYADDDSIEYAVYNGSDLVYREAITVSTGATEYTAKVDTSAGDKVIVTYYDDSAAQTYTAVMSNTAAYNDLQLVTTAASLKANIVSSDYVTYELSADESKVYLMALNTYNLPVSEIVGDANVDNLVANYVFAGWYVNGEKVSKDLTYTVDNLDSNVVMALYEFDGYYEVDKPVSADNGISPTVLAIGIAAVIIALIALVYAVIQKKE